ncbi:putative T-box transcription factor TBX22-like [Scophthalmus maximus]|uniref:Putative T-box transcription factor TBX22-like n=1 Tax=Scophthalmus maximus TaxID=52904 RepID=A0A2U9C771_SCOMX|nr:putative T-box transcription factor TBX22-like [Scophthalmus maximus]
MSRESCAGRSQSSDGYKARGETGSLVKMQGLSSRAHAFSVEALVGKPCKRMKVSEGHESSSAGDTGGDTSIFTGGEGKPRESDCRPDREVRVELQGSELWKRFYEIGTEMIITKAGRRMFPSVRVKVRNLDPCQQYYIAMDVMPVDSKRYRYVYHSSQWMVAGNTDHSCISPRLYVHPDSPCAGETWMRQVISFDRVKLTNNEMDDKGHIILQSMHKYKPRVHIIRHDPRMDLSQIQSLPAEGVHSFSFPETEFTTVTAYQNQQITKLKIDRNPFAKGFRDPGRNRELRAPDRRPEGPPAFLLIPIPSPGPSLLPHLSDTAGPYCLYRYSFPLSPQLAAISRHAKLAEDTTDCLLRQSPWHPTTNHCL